HSPTRSSAAKEKASRKFHRWPIANSPLRKIRISPPRTPSFRNHCAFCLNGQSSRASQSEQRPCTSHLAGSTATLKSWSTGDLDEPASSLDRNKLSMSRGQQTTLPSS